LVGLTKKAALILKLFPFDDQEALKTGFSYWQACLYPWVATRVWDMPFTSAPTSPSITAGLTEAERKADVTPPARPMGLLNPVTSAKARMSQIWGANTIS
jgi:hypothetical protein